MNKKYKAKGFYKGTNRRRTTILIARDEVAAVEFLKTTGYTDPFEIEEIFEPPDIDQLKWAKKLDIDIPEGASREDLYALCYKTQNGDSDAHPDLIEFATSRGLYFSKYRSQKDLSNMVYHTFTDQEKMANYAFKVYLWLTDDPETFLFTHRNKEVFFEFAKNQSVNVAFAKSLANNGGDWEYFGMTHFTDGTTGWGNSVNTIAYKTCAEFVQIKFGTPKTKTKTLESEYTATTTHYNNVAKNETKKSGCFGVFFLFVIFFLLAIGFQLTSAL